MMQRPLILTNIQLQFPQKVCFDGFSAPIHPGQRIALMGCNGSGKSSLLKIIQGHLHPTAGDVLIPEGTRFGYVPQVIDDFDTSSGGERLNHALTLALKDDPHILCLDEPTNHLDARNRRSLLRLLQQFKGTLIVASHDTELLRTCVDTLWDIKDGKIHLFSGSYDDYTRLCDTQRKILEHKLKQLDRDKAQSHQDLMREQARASKRKTYGEKKYEGETIALRSAQGKGENTTSRKKKALRDNKEGILHQLQSLRLPEIIKPRFSLAPSHTSPNKTIIAIRDGTCGYTHPLLEQVNLDIRAGERMAIRGDNGSGKSTLVKGILRDPQVVCTGTWTMPLSTDVGYLDQHYKTLNPLQTVLQVMETCVPTWTHGEIRRHLNDFLFRKNEAVMAPVTTLSGGEKVRLSLAQIAAQTPKALILDEVTNNLDLETREHVVQVLKHYPGTLIIISHDETFIQDIGIERFYRTTQGTLAED